MLTDVGNDILDTQSLQFVRHFLGADVALEANDKLSLQRRAEMSIIECVRRILRLR